jgi:ectoine hydroxylase-related dioxygenase (phytanoyl-CoA dioxygenase family)
MIIPNKNYGVNEQTEITSKIDKNIEDICVNGFTVLNDCFKESEIEEISKCFDDTKKQFYQMYSYKYLQSLDEHNSIRAPFLIDKTGIFTKLVTNKKLMKLVSGLIRGSFYLNQQNGIINPAGEKYNQGMWHRDLPYQHFTSSTPLGINALYCVDDFTLENGSTFVLPGTHKVTKFPSDMFVKENAKQIIAKSGSYIVLDCMIFHSGGLNKSLHDRRAVNHLFTIPHISKPIDYNINEIPGLVEKKYLKIFSKSKNNAINVKKYFKLKRS